MNNKQLRDESVTSKAICSGCGTTKWSCTTLHETEKSMLDQLCQTSHCCNNPMYWWCQS